MNQTQQEALRLYRDGLNTRQIGERLGITRQGVSHALIRAGVKPLAEKRGLAELRKMHLDQYCQAHPTTPLPMALAALAITRPNDWTRGDNAQCARKREREARGFGLCGKCGEVPLSEMEASSVNRCKACGARAQQDLAKRGRHGIRSPHTAMVLDLHRAGGMTQTQIGDVCGISQPQVSAIIRSARVRGEV